MQVPLLEWYSVRFVSLRSDKGEIPVFACGPIKLNAGDLVRILLDKQRHAGLVSQQQPLRVCESKVFVVDTGKLSDPDDIKSDDMGSWRNDGQHSRWVKVKQEKGRVCTVEFCSGKPKNDPNAYCLHRHYFIHHCNNQFKRKIAYLSGNDIITACSIYIIFVGGGGVGSR